MSSLAALVGFLLLSAPGLVYEAVREKCRPAIEQTPLREAGRVTLASTVFTGFAALLLTFGRLIFPSSVPDPGRWIASEAYRTAHWLPAAVLVTIGVLLACIFAALTSWLLYHGAARMLPEPVMWLAVRKVQPQPSKVSITVRLTSGDSYSGFLRGIDYGGDTDMRMVAIDAPLYRSGTPLAQSHRMVLALSQVEAMTFTFHEGSTGG